MGTDHEQYPWQPQQQSMIQNYWYGSDDNNSILKKLKTPHLVSQ